MVRDSIFSISFASSASFTQCTAILCDMVSDKCFFRPVVKNSKFPKMYGRQAITTYIRERYFLAGA
jgi:hypothetical protein